MSQPETTNRFLDDAIDTFRVKKEAITFALPIPGSDDFYFEFEFKTISDYAANRRLIAGAREFAKGCASKPTFRARFGDDLLEDEEGATTCYLCAELMLAARKKRRSQDGESDEVLEESGSWSQREWMRFAKSCPTMFLILVQQMSEALTITAIQGEDEKLEGSKKTSEMTDTSETISPSVESADSDTPINGTMSNGNEPETSSLSR